MTRPRIGDVVATSSGKLYRIRHTSSNGRHFLKPWEGSAHAPGRRNTWARAVTFVASHHVAQVHVYVRLALMHHRAGDGRALPRFEMAAMHYRDAVDAELDTATTLAVARDALNDAAGKLAVLDFDL